MRFRRDRGEPAIREQATSLLAPAEHSWRPAASYFDPVSDFSSADFAKIQATLERQRRDMVRGEEYFFTAHLAPLAILFPGELAALGVTAADNVFPLSRDMVRAEYEYFSVKQWAKWAADTAATFPEEFFSPQATVGQKDLKPEAILRAVEEARRQKKWYDLADLIYSQAIIFPEQRAALATDEVRAELFSYAHQAKKAHNRLRATAALRVLVPGPGPESLQLSATTWEQFQGGLRITEQTRFPLEWLQFAAQLAITTADEVHVAERGIELVRNPRPNNAGPTLPARAAV